MNAEKVCAEFLNLDGTEAAIEFGSSARDQDHIGDVDVLVVVDDSRRRRVVVDLAEELSDQIGVPVSATVFTLDTLAKRLNKAPSFAAHLREEGNLIGTSEATAALRSVLDGVVVTSESLELERAELQERFRRLCNRSKVAGSYGTALGRLYAIGRAASILRLMSEGDTDYDWRTAFRKLTVKRPELEGHLDIVASLRPYFDALDGRLSAEDLDLQSLREEYEKSLDAVAVLTDNPHGDA